MPCANEGAFSPNSNGEEPCSFGLEETSLALDTSSVESARVESHTCTRSTSSKVVTFSRDKEASFNALHPLPGEEPLEPENWIDMARCRLFLSHYRILIVTYDQRGVCSIPILAVDSVEAKDLVILQINCKDGRVFRIRAKDQETACSWYKKLTQKTCTVRKLDDVFAFKFTVASCQRIPPWLKPKAKSASLIPSMDASHEALRKEFETQRFPENQWRISSANKEFSLCATYPKHLIVPASVSDESLKSMRRGRFFNRFPTAVWRSKHNGAVLLRSAQPEISFFGAPSEDDVELFNRIRSVSCTEEKPKMLIVDARSYTAAWANRAKGGGFESSENYFCVDVQFMGLPNIHNIRYSFHQLRALISSSVDQSVYLQSVQATQWLQYLTNLLAASDRCVDALCVDGTSVLVHCSDGWDRTAQIVSLCKLIADPTYRTFEGFEQLVKREWIEFGHKFADRNGVLNGDNNEKSPVFLQWLDCVHQLWLKNSDAFEFNQRYLMKLAQHSYSGIFGDFLFNSTKDALAHSVLPQSDEYGAEVKISMASLFVVWDYLRKDNPKFVNPAFNPLKKRRLNTPKVMWEIALWREVYCCTDVEAIVNNPDEELTTPGTKAAGPTTMSRSQSASSLTSLDQNASHTPHGSNHVNGNVGSLSVSPSLTSCATYMSRASDALVRVQDFLDEDGLSRVPIDYEDRVVELYCKLMELQLATKRNSYSEFPKPHTDSFTTTTSTSSLPNGYSKRNRNESVDSSTFEIVTAIDSDSSYRRHKHDSCGASSSCSMFDPIAECERTRGQSKCDAATHESASRTSSMVAENGASNGHLPCEGGGCADCVETVPTRSNEQIVVG